MTENRTGLILCRDERFCSLLENELAYVGVRAVICHAPPITAEQACILLWDCDSAPPQEGIAAATALACPLILFGRNVPEPEPAVGNVACLRRPFVLTALERTLHSLLTNTAPIFAPVDISARSDSPRSKPSEPLSLRALNGAVTVGDRTVPLTPAEWEIFKYLYDHRGEPVSREDLASLLGGGGNSVDVYVCHLRAKIEKPLGRRMIHTVRGVGYRLDDFE